MATLRSPISFKMQKFREVTFSLQQKETAKLIKSSDRTGNTDVLDNNL